MDILKRPLITEKITLSNEKGVYGFVVDKKANKIQIKKAIEQTYGVNVQEVRTMVYQGKLKTRFSKGGTIEGRKQAYKKAVVQLAPGEIIDFYGDSAATQE